MLVDVSKTQINDRVAIRISQIINNYKIGKLIINEAKIKNYKMLIPCQDMISDNYDFHVATPKGPAQ